MLLGHVELNIHQHVSWWLADARIQGISMPDSDLVKLFTKMKAQHIPMQAGKLKIFGTRPNWVVSCIAYTKFHSPNPVFHSPNQIFTRIGDRASASFPAC